MSLSASVDESVDEPTPHQPSEPTFATTPDSLMPKSSDLSQPGASESPSSPPSAPPASALDIVNYLPEKGASLKDVNLSLAIPDEIWLRIFSHLRACHLIHSVVPVCNKFRRLGTATFFENVIKSDVNLGHDWMQWYDDLPFELLERHGATPKKINFELSDEVREQLRVSSESIHFYLGIFADDENARWLEDSATLSVEQRRRMIDAVDRCPGLRALKIHHQSFERVEPRRREDDLGRRQSLRIERQNRDCKQTTDFVEKILRSCQSSLLELDMSIACACPRESRRLSVVSTHACYKVPRFYLSHLCPISHCLRLTSLTLGNGFSGSELLLALRNLSQLRSLHLKECAGLKTHHLRDLSECISEGKVLTKLMSLRLEQLDRDDVLPEDFDNLFRANPEFGLRLAYLGIEYSSYPDDASELLQQRPNLSTTFSTCANLEELRLHLPLKPHPNFSHMTRLKKLRFLQPCWLGLRDINEEPGQPPIHFLSQLPSLRELTICPADLPPSHSPAEYFGACLGRLTSLNLIGCGRSRTNVIICRALSACRKTLRRLRIDDVLVHPVPLTEADLGADDFILEELELGHGVPWGRGGDTLFKFIPSVNLRNLVKFHFIRDPNINTVGKLVRESPGIDAIQEFVLRVCDSAGANLRELHWDCCVDIDHAQVVSKMPSLRTLRLDIFDVYGPHSLPICECSTYRRSCPCIQETMFNESYSSFFHACNQLLPLDLADETEKDYRDHLLSFPSMTDFRLTTFLDCGDRVTPSSSIGLRANEGHHPESSCFGVYFIGYHVRRTCFGHVKRFLEFSTVVSGPKRYAALSPEDIYRDSPLPLQRVFGDQYSELRESC